MHHLRLISSIVDCPVIALDAMRGRHEFGQCGRDYPSALRLVRSLFFDQTGALPTHELENISVADFDRILDTLHSQLFGSQYECQSQCVQCQADFEFAVHSNDIFASVEDNPLDVKAGHELGIFETRDGVKFRLPTVKETLLGKSAEQICEDVSLSGEFHSIDQADAAFRGAAPIGIQDIDAICPECEADQRVRFDLVQYVMTMLDRERVFLIQEFHSLAAHYGWSFTEIANLERRVRRDFAALITQERARRSVHRLRA